MFPWSTRFYHMTVFMKHTFSNWNSHLVKHTFLRNTRLCETHIFTINPFSYNTRFQTKTPVLWNTRFRETHVFMKHPFWKPHFFVKNTCSNWNTRFAKHPFLRNTRFRVYTFCCTPVFTIHEISIHPMSVHPFSTCESPVLKTCEQKRTWNMCFTRFENGCMDENVCFAKSSLSVHCDEQSTIRAHLFSWSLAQNVATQGASTDPQLLVPSMRSNLCWKLVASLHPVTVVDSKSICQFPNRPNKFPNSTLSNILGKNEK